ncbi:MucBP domain-containing protein [Boudabousia marimammalium]|uniref:MucBP domain-containing protein n=1 Tax=Boudabousia marimammalium TaxID=156892 RepID=A0A1Q5PMA8_9ACTO|nr:MucBP domain-containing protein [Boudabousia marimammalium]OKL48615.1 hypothetical protein BM477_05240 [Boudabousia marimammalium]
MFTRMVVMLIFLLSGLSIPVGSAAALDLSGRPSGAGFKSMQERSRADLFSRLKDDVTVGDSGTVSTPEKDSDTGVVDKTPAILEAVVLGDFNKGAQGVDYFKNITISLIGDNLTDDHFLTPKGLHWSDKTEVELIRGQELGDFDFSTLPFDVPSKSIKAFSINNGDSGRITHVGTTKSGIDLDLIWTVTGSDKEDWAANSGYANNKVKGLSFTGEQFFPEAKGNSIAVLYNNASNLGLQYKIVKHGTAVEQPVIVSFISTDIDSAQGVETDLANIVEVIPGDSHLVKKDGIIYDTTTGAVNLNGSKDLPRGGYLGASFSSKFNYIFYSPAPERVNNSYHYPKAVRYDIFGSSLQAKLLTRLQQHISVRYVDTSGHELKPEEHYQGFRDKSYSFSSLTIAKHQLVDIKRDNTDLNHPTITFVYSPLHTVRFHFVDEAGRKLATDKNYTVLDGKDLSYRPIAIGGYDLPSEFAGKITQDTEYSFVYTKTVRPLPAPQSPASPKSASGFTPVPSTGHTGRQKQIPHARKPQPPSTKHVKPGISQPKDTRPNSKPAPKPGKAVAPAPANSPHDPFLVNTKMTKDEKKLFLDYVKEVGRQAREKYGNDKHQINHAIANAIAYPVYSNDKLQSLVNDFGDEPNVGNYSQISDKLKDSHREEPPAIDFPHFATTLASVEDSGLIKEAGKWLAGLSPSVLLGMGSQDNFFQQNSLTGDLLTRIDDKDRRTDLDAIIFHYHPDYKDLSLDEAIIKYYHTENLDLERERLYLEVLKAQAGQYLTVEEQQALNVFFASATLGGLGLMALTAYRRLKEQWKAFRESPSKYIKSVAQKIGAGFISFFKDPLEFIGSKVLGPVANLVADSLVLGAIIAKKAGGIIYDHVIKPVAHVVNKLVVQPLNKYVVKPVYKHVIKPVLSFTENKLLKPVVRKVIKPVAKFVHKNIVRPIIRRVVPVAKYVRKKIIRPVSRFVRNRIVKPVYRRVIKPVYRRIIKPVYKKLIRPVVKPIYRKVIRPIGRFVKNKIFKPVSRFVKNKIAKPIGRFIKRLWG